MWVVTHTLSGLALGAVLVERGAHVLTIVMAALLLHILLDLVPHWDYTRVRCRVLCAAADASVSFGILWLAWAVGGFEWPVILAGVLSALPDLDVVTGSLSRRERPVRLFPSHWRGFPHGSAPPLPGVLVQVAVAAVSGVTLLLGR
ncbi:MAG TPA: hypothetical protein VFH17_03340 [Coriobacteriia bacterium]|nr:hypothetical protein [Coriobacteriia bacterium]